MSNNTIQQIQEAEKKSANLIEKAKLQGASNIEAMRNEDMGDELKEVLAPEIKKIQTKSEEQSKEDLVILKKQAKKDLDNLKSISEDKKTKAANIVVEAVLNL